MFWIQRLPGEKLVSYYDRALTERGEDPHVLAFRKGGGNSIGLRLAQGQVKPQARAWKLSGCPASWDADDVVACLREVGCSDVTALSPPRGKGPWLVRCIPPEDVFGFMAIEAAGGKVQLSLTQVLAGAMRPRGTEKVERVGSGVVGKKTSGLNPWSPVPKLPSVSVAASATEGPGKMEIDEGGMVDAAVSTPAGTPAAAAGAGEGESAHVKGKDRSRSPIRSGKSRAWQAEQVDKLCDLIECGGGGGRCGYNVLACALALRSGKKHVEFKDNLVAMGRTIRNDVYQHLEKHADRYRSWFWPDTNTTEALEGGPVPNTWEEFLAATLRDTRWVCGLTLLAASRRFGVQIVVIDLGDDTGRRNDPMSFGVAAIIIRMVLSFWS